jgi:tripartite-type tricarboxylate transporter receptor subunit TctC
LSSYVSRDLTMLNRRAILALPALLAAPTLHAPALHAQSPRAIRLVIPFGAGGITDLVARILAERASLELGVPIVAENRAGANGNIAGEHVARSAPDGTTLLMASLAMFAVNPVIYPRMGYDPASDFAPVALAASTPHVVVAHPGSVGPDFAAMLGAARARPEALSWGTAGAGSSPHLTAILLQSLSGAELLAVHFRSGAASVQSVIAGQVALTAEATPIVAEHVRAGTLRALAVAAPERLALLPDVPTTAEAGLPGLENGSTSAIVAPRGTPDAVLARLAEAFRAAMAAPETRARLSQQGTIPLGGTGAEFTRMINTEVARWRPLLAGVQPG